ncbi:hypothetical protein [Alienimonas sp. DA493]|uniref:hypothetical protein n=1 Tax=Alienimonas sp. DA493 TaxID=3373605 RepID=UPI0037542123
MTRGRFAAHVRRRRGLWIAGGVLAVLLGPYVTAFVCLRRSYWVSMFVVHPERGSVSCTHQFHAFAGGREVSPALHAAFTPIHRWCLGGMTGEEFSSLSAAEMTDGPRDVYVTQDLMDR